MPQSGVPDVVAHWYKLFEGFETSPGEFYAAVGEALDRRKLPGLKRSRVRATICSTRPRPSCKCASKRCAGTR